jgi:hypothetical protein
MPTSELGAGTAPSAAPSARSRTPRLFLLLRPIDNPSGTIYGTLVGASVLAAEGGKREGIGEIAFVVVVTLVVYWFAHGYSEMLPARAARPTSDGRPHALRDLTRSLRTDWPIVGGPLALIGVLLLASLFGADANLAVDLALWFAVAELLLWGVLAARAANLQGFWILLYGLGSASMGVVITLLKILLH